MQTFTLKAAPRTAVGKQVRQLRRKGIVPATLYGGEAPRNVELDEREFIKLFSQAGESSLVDVTVGADAPVKVLIQDIQRDPLRGGVIHVDLRQVRMDRALEAQVLLRFLGEAPAVKEQGAILVKSLDSITVRCLPKDLVHEIDIDLSGLKKIDDRITVKDIVPPAGVEFMARPEATIVVIVAPISEEELAALEAKPEVDVTAVKVETEEKKAERAADKEAVEKKKE